MKGLIDRMPLRVRLVVASTLLVAVGLAISGFVAATTLRGYLVDRVDAQLVDAAGHYGGPELGGPPVVHGPNDVDGDANGLYVVYYDASGARQLTERPIFGPSAKYVPRLPGVLNGGASSGLGVPYTVSSSSGGPAWRAVSRPLFGGRGTVTVAQSLSDVDHTVGRLQLLELLIGLGVVAVLAGAGYVVVRRSLRPLTEVERTAEAIAAGDLTQRVPTGHPGTEVGRLSAALNAMLAQIERAFHVQQQSEQAARRSEEQMRQFVADASHELRTPLTSIRGFSELYRQGAVASDEELARVMRRIEDEAMRMGVLVDDLLLLARLDQRRPLERQPVDVNLLAAEAVEDVRVIAPDRPIEFHGVDGGAVVNGDELRLRQVLGNLLGNALTHTPPSSRIDVSVDVRADGDGRWVVLEVTDHGPGLEPEHAARVFERFYRVDAARSRSEGGSGLGLSIVAGLTDAHGGRVELDTAVGQGATFRVLLPLATDVATV